TAVNRLKNSTAKTRVLILLTDGINNRGEIDPRDAATMARDFGVRIYTIGVGTRGQAPYPVTDPFGNRQFVMVDVEIDEPLLKEIASRTGGLYFRATDRESLAGVFAEIDRWEKTDIKVRETHEKHELFPYFLGLGLLLGVLVEVARRTVARVLP
ncbi:MAG TPA: VWA domain-containing protein, partial [Candidatus Aminicenantes bacterium]|nr:VWA domain-containing protein [Candidatus Aminicenantes bacterium]